MSNYQDLINKASGRDLTQPEVVSQEPVVPTEPVTPSEPVIPQEPVAQAEPVVTSTPEPVASTEPVATPEPVVPAEPVSTQAPVTTPEPTTPQVPEGYFSQEDVDKMKAEMSNAQFADERVKFINDYVKNNGTLDEKFWKYQSQDFENVKLDEAGVDSVVDIIRQELSDVQGYSNDEVDLVIKRKYPDLYRGVDGDGEAEDIQRYDDDFLQAKMDAKKSLANLQDYKNKVTMPAQAAQSNQPTPEQLAKAEAQMKEYTNSVNQVASNFTHVDLNVSEGVNIQIPTTPESVGYVKDVAANPTELDNFFYNNFVKDGVVDHQGLQESIYKMKNFDSLMKSAVNQAMDIAKEQVLKEHGLQQTLEGKATATSTTSATAKAAQDYLSQIRR